MSDQSGSGGSFVPDSEADVHGRLSDVVFALDEQWRFSYLDARAADAFGKPASELLGTDARERTDEAFDSTFRRACERALETGNSRTFETFADPFGGWIEVRVYPSETGLSVYCRDTTPADEGGEEAELRKRERALRRAYEIVADPDRSFDEQVDALLETVRDAIGTEYATLSRVHEETAEYVFEHIAAPEDADLEAGDTVPLESTNCERTVSTERTLALNDVQSDAPGLADRAGNAEWGIACYLGTPVVVRDDVYGTFCFYGMESRSEEFSEWDVTFVELLGNWVSYELDRRRRERDLEDSNERLEEFASVVSHDLQEPLRMVSSYLSLIEERYADELDEEGREFLGFAVDGADRMREMIDALLAYSRVETQGQAFEPVELDAVLEDVLADLRLQLEETDATVSAEPLPRVYGDGDQLGRVFQNLLENAIAYSGEDSPHIEIDATRADDTCVVSVRDEGVGIDSGEADRIFEIFERLHTGDHDGTGIGLALCRRIVERHDGEIWVESEPGEGSTFSFRLPTVDGTDD